MNVTDGRHFNFGGGSFSELSPEVYDDPNGVVSEDGNTVERDLELSKMAENKILYDATVQLMNRKLAQIRYIINESR